MKWFVYKESFDGKKLEKFNIFCHTRFKENVSKSLKTCNNKNQFSEELKRHLTYYYWSKYEYEITASSWPPRIDQKELERLNSENKKYNEKYGHCPHSLPIRLTLKEKIDIYDQITMNYEVFLDYLWSFREGCGK